MFFLPVTTFHSVSSSEISVSQVSILFQVKTLFTGTDIYFDGEIVTVRTPDDGVASVSVDATVPGGHLLITLTISPDVFAFDIFSFLLSSDIDSISIS